MGAGAPGDPALWVAEDADGHRWHLLAIPHHASSEAGIQRVRDAARRTLREQLARGELVGVQLPALEGPRWSPGATAVSASHGPTLSVAAWCDRGTIGVDLVELAVLETMGPDDLRDTAALYLDPAAQRWIRGAAGFPQALRRFAAAWARREAWLKCAGLALEESPRDGGPGPAVRVDTLALYCADAAAPVAVLSIAHDTRPTSGRLLPTWTGTDGRASGPSLRCLVPIAVLSADDAADW